MNQRRLAVVGGLVALAAASLSSIAAADEWPVDADGGAAGGFGAAAASLAPSGGFGAPGPSGVYLNYFGDGAIAGAPGDPSRFLADPGSDPDAVGIGYYFRAAGLEVGVSYQPTAEADRPFAIGVPAAPDGVDDQFAFGANYRGDLGGVSFEFGGGYLINDDEDRYHVGAGLGYGGVAVTGFFNLGESAAAPDEELYGVGARYSAGPFTFGGGYVRTEFAEGGRDEDYVHFGGGYQIAPGVTAYAAAQYGDEGDEEGYGGFAGLGLKF